MPETLNPSPEEINPTAERMHEVRDAYNTTDPELSRRERRRDASTYLNTEASEAGKPEYKERIINKYIGEYKVGDKAACIDAIHSVKPKQGEIITVLMEEFPNLTVNDAMQLVAKVEQDKKTTTRDWDNFETSYPDQAPEIIERYRVLAQKHEVYTATIARRASKEAEASYFRPRHSRLFSDTNRGINTDTTIDGIKPVEYPIGVQEAIDFLLTRFFEKKQWLDQEGKLTRPYIHISVHGKANQGGDILIANGMKNGKLPCDPRIARWVQESISSGLQKVDEEMAESVVFAREGHRLCGSSVNVERRWGEAGLNGLGPNYQHVQIEMSLRGRKEYAEKIADILARISDEFDQKFTSQEHIAALPTVPEDIARLDGSLYFDDHATLQSERTNIVWLGANLRSALGVKSGETVNVNGTPCKVLKPLKEHLKERKPLLPSASDIDGPITISKT